MEIAVPLLTGVCLSACTGFRAFLPPFLLGLIHAFLPAWVQPFTGLSFLSRTPVLLALGVAVVVEFLGDKIPFVDHLLDMIHLPVKIVLSSAIIVLLLPPGDVGWFFPLVGLILGTGSTAAIHTGKLAMRGASTVSTAGFLNPFISLAEDAIALLGTLLAILVPVLCLILVAFFLFRTFRFLFGPKGGNEGEFSRTKPSLGFYRVIKLLGYALFRVYNRMSISGGEHLPAKGPFMIVANHASILDGFLLGAGVQLPVSIMVKKEAFENPFSGWFLRKSLAFPVDRKKPDPTTIKTCLRVLSDGGVLGLFPEGTRNLQGLIRPFKPGAIRMAVKQKVPVVPAYIANSHLLTPPHTVIPRPAKLMVGFGPPVDVPGMLKEGKTEAEIQEVVFKRVCDLGQALLGKDVRDFSEVPDTEGQESASKAPETSEGAG